MRFLYSNRMIKAILSCLVLAFICSLTCSTETVAQSALEQGEMHYFNQQYDLSQGLLTPLATSENKEAQYYLALVYKAQKQYKKAAEWFQKAGDNGYSQAYFEIGILYDNGEGFSLSPVKAMDWYRKAKIAETNSIGPTTIEFYKKNKSGNDQKLSAHEMFEEQMQLAITGDAGAQFQVANQLDYGIAVPRNFVDALNWYRQAAENGHEEAQFLMGYFYCRGLGTEKNKSIANIWFLKSRRNVCCK